VSDGFTYIYGHDIAVSVENDRVLARIVRGSGPGAFPVVPPLRVLFHEVLTRDELTNSEKQLAEEYAVCMMAAHGADAAGWPLRPS
jgi:hypothetical protein